MTSERWQQSFEILEAALELEPEEVSTFIAERCAGDDEMKVEVQSLYESFRKREKDFDVPAPEIVAQDIAQRAQQPMLKEGQCLGEEDRYEICGMIGEGGFAQVYKAKDKKLDGRYVAVKIFSPSPENRSPDARRRFRDEVRAVAKLGHPNIITVLDIGKYEIEGEGYTPFIVTEFIDGVTLRQHMKHAQIELSTALDIAIRLTSALIPVHNKEMVHRDIKPDNIMLGPDGLVKIFDFGVAKLMRKEMLASESQEQGHEDTKSGAIIGSNKYMSPEQLQGARDVDPRSDIWAVGVVLYEMIAGKVPFDGPNRDVVSHRILSDEKPKPLSKYSSNVRPELERLVSKALSKDRDKRYQKIEELFLDLQKLRAMESTEHQSYLKTVFFNLLSWLSRTSAMLFKSKGLEPSTADGQENGRLEESPPTGEDTERTRLAEPHERSSGSTLPKDDAPPRASVLAVALESVKSRRGALVAALAVLIVLIMIGLILYRPRRLSTTNRNGEQKISNTGNNIDIARKDGNVTPSPSPSGSPSPVPEEKPDRLVWKRNLRAQRGVALAVALSPDGKTAASGGEHNEVRLWDTSSWNSQRLQSPFESRANEVTSIAFSHDNRMIASSSKDKNILLWDRQDQSGQPRPLMGHSDEVNVVAFSPTEQFLASGGKDRAIILWDLQSSKSYRLEHNGEILAIAFSPDGNTLASAAKEETGGTIRIWDVQRVKNRNTPTVARDGESQVLCSQCGEVYALAFSCDGRILVSGGGDNRIRQWDWLIKQELVKKALGPVGEPHNFITALAFSPDCKSLVSASGDGIVRIWDLKTGTVQTLRNHNRRVNSISFSNTGMLISGSHDGTVKIWQLMSG